MPALQHRTKPAKTLVAKKRYRAFAIKQKKGVALMNKRHLNLSKALMRTSLRVSFIVVFIVVSC
jgi:hypothetical protein